MVVGLLLGYILFGSDFFSRFFDQRSVVRFGFQEWDRFCRVIIIDDFFYEVEESFKVVLIDVMGGLIGIKNEIIIFIEVDLKDGKYFVLEF